MAKQKSVDIKIITLFPGFVHAYTQFGIIAKAVKNKLLKFTPVNLRQFGLDARGTVDDRPYGGGVGMVLRPDVLYKAIQFASKQKPVVGKRRRRIILLTPSGKPFHQADAKRFAKYDELIFVSGRYEGYDERITKFIDEEVSIGDYVLMGGELPALVITEAVIRLRPGIIGKLESTENESFSENLLEYPQYTKPEAWNVGNKKIQVPKVLRSGNHAMINEWRNSEALKRTKKRRPDLLA